MLDLDNVLIAAPKLLYKLEKLEIRMNIEETRGHFHLLRRILKGNYRGTTASVSAEAPFIKPDNARGGRD